MAASSGWAMASGGAPLSISLFYEIRNEKMKREVRFIRKFLTDFSDGIFKNLEFSLHLCRVKIFFWNSLCSDGVFRRNPSEPEFCWNIQKKIIFHPFNSGLKNSFWKIFNFRRILSKFLWKIIFLNPLNFHWRFWRTYFPSKYSVGIGRIFSRDEVEDFILLVWLIKNKILGIFMSAQKL